MAVGGETAPAKLDHEHRPALRTPQAGVAAGEPEASPREDAPVTAQRALLQPRGLTPNAVRHLQRAVGNQAVGTMLSRRAPSDALVSLPVRGMTHPIAAELQQQDVQFRVPSFAKLKAAYTDPDLKIPEKVIQDRVAQLLGRMKKEGNLKSSDPVPTIIAKIFPGPGKIDETEFNNALDLASQEVLYKSVIQANTQVKTADKGKLITAMKDAVSLIKKVEGDATGLTQVFGAQSATAKANYAKAAAKLEAIVKDLDKYVTTDYNLDDSEVGLGGYALHDKQKIHLLLDVAQVKDVDETKSTVIHEACHLSDASVKDHVYYGDDGFFEAKEDIKVANAAHYEELPKRDMKTSSFDKKTFTPGAKPGGGAVTHEDSIKADTANYMREAWDAGVDAHLFIRAVRRDYEKGIKKTFTDNKALVLEISRLMDLTIHEQAAGKAIVTTLDVTLSESIAKGVDFIKGLVKSEPVPTIGAKTDEQVRDEIVAAATAKYGELLKDPARDKKLLDWLVAHYHSLPFLEG